MTAAKRNSASFWSETIPNDWQEPSLRYIASIRNGSDYKEFEVAEGGYPVIGSGGEFARSSKFVYDGESVLLGRKGTVDKPLYINDRFWTVDTMFYTNVGQRILAKFLHYFATTIPFGYFQTNTAVPSMTQGDLGSIKVPLPNLETQRAIVEFLERETSQIEDLIGKQERLIELLTEKRQAVITQAVTKGLNPNTPTKPSGVPWLGDIPAHWASSRLKFALSRIEQGVSPQADAIPASLETWGVLKSGCVNGGVFRESENKQLPVDFVIDPNCVVAVGDLLVSRASGSPKLVGSAARVRHLETRLILSDKTFRFVPRAEIDADFLEWFLNSLPYRKQVEGSISGAEGLANNISTTALKNVAFARPPRSEQVMISADIQRSVDALYSLEAKSAKAVKLLRERRSALISAAVTGKIDVREGVG